MTNLTLKEFFNSKNITQITPNIRVNTNGYPFITCIDSKNVSENIYFSKAAAQGVKANQPVTKELLSNYGITITKNAEGEERIKLSSNSERLNVADLL